MIRDDPWQVSTVQAGASSDRNASDDFWWGPLELETAAGMPVTVETVLQIPEVFDCLSVISQTEAQLPLMIYARDAAGEDRTRLDVHPLAPLLHHRANPMATAYEFRSAMTWDLALHRNAFAEIRADGAGRITELWWLDAECVELVRLPDGSFQYEVRDGFGMRRLDPSRVFHLRAPPLRERGLLGKSMLRCGRQVFSRALAIMDYAGRFFANDATPGGIITLPVKFADEESRRQYKRAHERDSRGRNRHRIRVFDMDAKFTALDVPNEKAQFIETAKEVALQVLRFWRMPPHKVGILVQATFGNIEQQALEFVTDTMLPWLVAWEQGIRRDLLGGAGQVFAEHNVAGLLRGDLKARYEAYAVARNWGWLNVNDIRRLENMNGIGPQGDIYLQPLNMAPAGAAAANAALGAAGTPGTGLVLPNGGFHRFGSAPDRNASNGRRNGAAGHA